jgi:purine-binding chemotaxis protein CheW
LPQPPFFMEGVINLRGHIIPVIDLRKRLGLEISDYNDGTRIIVVEFSGQTVGAIVDAVREVAQVDTD